MKKSIIFCFFANPSLRQIEEQLQRILSNMPDPFATFSLMDEVLAVAESCTDELNAYSRHLGRKGNKPYDAQIAQSLLPADLRDEVPITVAHKGQETAFDIQRSLHAATYRGVDSEVSGGATAASEKTGEAGTIQSEPVVDSDAQVLGLDRGEAGTIQSEPVVDAIVPPEWYVPSGETGAIQLEPVVDVSGNIDRFPARWYGPGERVTVRGFELPGMLFLYTGQSSVRFDWLSHEASAIDPGLSIGAADAMPSYGEGMADRPSSYVELTEKCRCAYLKWLATGRRAPNACIGYVFLFLYGLERRLVTCGPDEDITAIERTAIVQEIRSLISIYGHEANFGKYATYLLAWEWALYSETDDIPEYLDMEQSYFSSDAFRVRLSQIAKDRRPLPASTALQWVQHHPKFRKLTPVTRCASEFRKLFALRYSERFGSGILLPLWAATATMGGKLTISCFFATPSARQFEKQLQRRLSNMPDPFATFSLMHEALAVAESCIGELNAYSRHLGRKGNKPHDARIAQSLLPAVLRNEVPITVAHKGQETAFDIQRPPHVVALEPHKAQLPTFPHVRAGEQRGVSHPRLPLLPQSKARRTPQGASFPKAGVPTARGPAFSLNEELIRTREQETQHVRSVLDGVFAGQVEERESADPQSEERATLGAGLDQAHLALLARLMEQERWERPAVEAMCKELSLMPNGALEVLNEWALANVDSPLIENGDIIFIDTHLAGEMANG